MTNWAILFDNLHDSSHIVTILDFADYAVSIRESNVKN